MNTLIRSARSAVLLVAVRLGTDPSVPRATGATRSAKHGSSAQCAAAAVAIPVAPDEA